MVNAPSVSLKVVVLAHFILSVWASMVGSPFLGASYIYMNAFILAFGVWALICPDTTEPVITFMLLNLISIIMDIIFLGVLTPYAHSIFETQVSPLKGAYRFSLGMAIVNLILKPFSSFILYRLYQDRGGQYSGGEFGIPGVSAFGGSSGSAHGSNYENIDQASPAQIETASPHSMVDKSPYDP
ncbi:hypothetical protein CAPTEDRAFT_220979 [Capitella teleta]|uniref:Type-1 angiotensin II receptor-associated protein n=1 Tax=Capitella teleta TaxID=283909 RepID=R7TVJ1_CAPTE|nr:hypothetical protein CAPTEDRAFT_220979 [Capitella teleta]|eukprot:ELT95481.1 hypothetical protein CAPTEDRAFT_220979 [Capitella teleta]